MRVVIGIPTQWGLWRAQMAMSLIHAIHDMGNHDVALSPQQGPYLAMNRQAAARVAVESKADYLIFVDTDMVFPPWSLRTLMDRKKDIIGANYYEKKLPLVSTVKLLGGDGELLQDGKFVTIDTPKEPFQVGGLGAGLLCINVPRMVSCMASPYFTFVERRGEPMGEDVTFCDRARKSGLEVWCDPTLPVGHIGDMVFGLPMED